MNAAAIYWFKNLFETMHSRYEFDFTNYAFESLVSLTTFSIDYLKIVFRDVIFYLKCSEEVLLNGSINVNKGAIAVCSSDWTLIP